MVKQGEFERNLSIPARESDFIMFNVESKDELLLFDIEVKQSSGRTDDIQIYILDKSNYQKYLDYYRASRSGRNTNVKRTTYAQAKASWIPIYFHSKEIGTYYLVFDNLHSTITGKIIHVSGTSSSHSLQKLTKSPTTVMNNNSLLNMHHKLLLVSEKLFHNGHYSQAVFEASKLLETEIKKKSKIKKIGESLANEVFNEQYPILKINSLKTPEEIDEQKGFRYLYAGTFVGIKNPRSHSIDKSNDKTLAIEYLSLINLLFKKLENSKLSKSQKMKSKKIAILAGVGPVTTKKLAEMDIVTIEDLSKADPKELTEYSGLFLETSKDLIKKASSLLKK